MPLYEYACQECGQQSEQLITGSGQPACPQCGSSHLNRLLSIVAAPNRATAYGGRDLPPGSCGTGCACHPRR
jgi:putative FmdB family regulatory protein